MDIPKIIEFQKPGKSPDQSDNDPKNERLRERTQKRAKELKHYLKFPSNCRNLYFVERKPYDIRHRLKRYTAISRRPDLSFGGKGMLHWFFRLNKKWRVIRNKNMHKIGLDGKRNINHLYKELQKAGLLYIYQTLDPIGGGRSLNIYVLLVDPPPEGIKWNNCTFYNIIKSCVEKNHKKEALEFEIEHALTQIYT